MHMAVQLRLNVIHLYLVLSVLVLYHFGFTGLSLALQQQTANSKLNKLVPASQLLSLFLPPQLHLLAAWSFSSPACCYAFRYTRNKAEYYFGGKRAWVNITIGEALRSLNDVMNMLHL